MATSYRRDALDEIAHRLHNAPTIRTVCAWCGKLIHDGEVIVRYRVACPDCGWASGEFNDEPHAPGVCPNCHVRYTVERTTSISHGSCPECAKQWLEDARLPL